MDIAGTRHAKVETTAMFTTATDGRNNVEIGEEMRASINAGIAQSLEIVDEVNAELDAQAKKIRSITMHRVTDPDPDLSYLGEYSDSPGEHAIDRRGAEPGDQACCKSCYWSIRYDEPGGWHHITQDDEPYSETEEAEADHDAEPDSDYRGHGWDPRTYRYFNPVWQNYAGESPEDMARGMRADFERMEAYNNQQWGMLGIYAQAEIMVADTIQEVRSGGLYGIESDSDPSYFAEIEREELSALVTILEELGFERGAIDEACADVTDASD